MTNVAAAGADPGRPPQKALVPSFSDFALIITREVYFVAEVSLG
jgi:hypothetical protein